MAILIDILWRRVSWNDNMCIFVVIIIAGLKLAFQHWPWTSVPAYMMMQSYHSCTASKCTCTID